ncbi:MAG: GTPase Era [Bacteroidales bacterium]|jgi:GTP-binding protein Era|nr:GTPase Era [Bacteroidales bacterium]
MHRAGFVNIIGNPNVGKSTLMNALVGERLSIITSKAQTTRKRVMGIVNGRISESLQARLNGRASEAEGVANGEDFQIVYTDTPGIVNPHNKLHEQMMGFVGTALQDADLFILVTEVGETLKNRHVLDKVIMSPTPVLVVINKIDTSDQETIRQKIDYWQATIPRATVIPCSATEGFNVDAIFEHILRQLPEHPAYFPKDELTDRTMRFFVSEIVREKILLYYQKEIPYSCEVAVESYEERDGIDNISCLIFVERESQKAILIGHQGKAIKKLGIEARKDIEEFTGKRCFLSLHIKVLKDWRNSEKALKSFGYALED